jgi:hypothetical protein
MVAAIIYGHPVFSLFKKPVISIAASPDQLDPLMPIVRASLGRKLRAEKALRYYADLQSDETFRLIAQRWSKPETFRIFHVNLVKKIVNKRAALYRTAPRRTFNGWDQDAGDALYRAANADGVLKRASRLVKLLKTSAIQVGWENARPTLSVVTPNVLDVLYSDDPQYPQRFIVTHRRSSLGSNGGSTASPIALPNSLQTAYGYKTEPSVYREADVTYSDWTAAGYQQLDYRGMPLPVAGNPDGVNPFGILPFVPLWDVLPDDEFFIPGGDDLLEAQEAVNVALSNLWRAVELQAHGQAWASGIPAGEVLQIGPDRAVTLPEGGKFGFATPGAPIPDILNAIEFVMRQIASTNDLSADVFDLDRRSESGAAKHVEQVDLREARQDDITLWRQYETNLFEVLKQVVNTYAPGTIPAGATVSVDFSEMQENLTETERLNNARTKVQLGMWSPVDLLQAENPDAFSSRADAMAELRARQAEGIELGVTPAAIAAETNTATPG